MESKLKFAIIGCGKIAPRHAIEILKHGELVAVCDIAKDKADAFAQQFAAKSYYSIETLLQNEKELDVVVVCTPNGLHAEHSIQSLQAGQHVLCEKPMAISTLDAQRMIDIAEAAGKKLYVVKQNRYNPPVVFVKKLLEQNKLGNILSFQLNCFWNRPAAYYENSWKGTLRMDGGILYTQFSHFIDLLYWFLGNAMIVKGIRHNYLHKDCIEFEDTGIAFLQMENGAIGNIIILLIVWRKIWKVHSHCLGKRELSRSVGNTSMNWNIFQCPGKNFLNCRKAIHPMNMVFTGAV